MSMGKAYKALWLAFVDHIPDVAPFHPKGCYEWIGTFFASGYGSLSFQDKTYSATRTSLSLALGRPIRKGYFAIHMCDNPACVRVGPKHLVEGLPQDNVTDMCNKGRHRNQMVTHCPQRHPYDEANTLISDNKNGSVRRVCKMCRDKRNKSDNMKKWRFVNKQYLKSYYQKWVQHNREKCRVAKKRWRDKQKLQRLSES